MQVIHASDAHLCEAPHPNSSFGLFDAHTSPSDAAHSEQIRELLFTRDTVPLSEPQKDVVQALLSRRSALFVAPTSHQKHPVLVDVFMRSRLWKELIVYCAESPRAAETAYTLVCAQLGTDGHQEVQLHLDSLPDPAGADIDRCRLIITSPALMRSALANCDESEWLQKTSIFFVDTLSHSNAPEWEEILLALPSRILLCVFTTDLPPAEHQLLPLWMETIQNRMLSVTPSREASFLHRIESPQHFPLLRTFAYNAAVHDSPVQVSLTLLKEMLNDKVKLCSVPKYSECFLHGIKMIPTESVPSLLFRSVGEARFADIAALVVADAKSVHKKCRRKRGRRGKGKVRSAASRAAAQKRRDAAYEASLLFPAIAFVCGRDAAEHAARAVESALGEEVSLFWDDDSREHVEDLVQAFKSASGGDLSDTDIGALDILRSGVGVVHGGLAPAVRLVVEELFRCGCVPVLCADSFLGGCEIAAMPCAKSILMDASAIGVCDDSTKGLVGAATVAALAGRAQKDDVGNLVLLWYDECVDDETAGYEIASTLLHGMFTGDGGDVDDVWGGASWRNRRAMRGGGAEEVAGEERYCALSSSYGGVLRSVRRFGTDGYESIFEYTLNSYRGWVERAAMRATVERLEVEKRAIRSRLDCEDWGSLAEYERREAKVNELKRVLKAMERRYADVLRRRVFNELRASAAGRLIGVAVDGEAEGGEWMMLAGAEGEGRGRGLGSELVGADGRRKDEVVCGVFVGLLDEEAAAAGMEGEAVVVCILADGLWTMVGVSDVVALAEEGAEVVSNVDVVMMPHAATFDAVDSGRRRATCRPIDVGERDAVERISDELMRRVASEGGARLQRCAIAEFDAQK
ncbi:unnamed protein product, partial [Agarophyton chilense]